MPVNMRGNQGIGEGEQVQSVPEGCVPLRMLYIYTRQ